MPCRISVAVVALVLSSSAVAQNEPIKKPLSPSGQIDPSLGVGREDPGAPPSESATCGNGKVDYRPQQICASCIPGRPCQCGWTSVPAEECDGQDFAGATCKTFGFEKGDLRCTPECKRDLSGCWRPPPPPPPAWLGKLIRAGSPQGTEMAAALNGSTLLVAGAYGAYLEVRSFDAKTLYAAGNGGRGQLPPPENYANQTLIDVFAAPLADGFVVAVLRFGEPRTYLFRVTAKGSLEGPIATVDARPIFLAGGKDTALLGTTQGVALLGRDGKPQGGLKRLFDLPTWGQAIHAHAVPMKEGWAVAIAVRKNAESTARLTVAAVSASGTARIPDQSMIVNDAYDPLTIASEGSRAFVVFDAQGAGLSAAEVKPDLSLGPERKLSPDFYIRVLGSSLAGDVLTAWVSAGRSKIHRIRLTLSTGAVEDKELMDVPRADSVTLAATAGFADLVLKDEDARPLLYRDE